MQRDKVIIITSKFTRHIYDKDDIHTREQLTLIFKEMYRET